MIYNIHTNTIYFDMATVIRKISTRIRYPYKKMPLPLFRCLSSVRPYFTTTTNLCSAAMTAPTAPRCTLNYSTCCKIHSKRLTSWTNGMYGPCTGRVTIAQIGSKK